MWRIANKLGGSVAGKAEIGYVVAKWISRGLSATPLANVRNVITGVPAP